MSVPRIRVHIDELALRGYAPGDSAAIGAALRGHLAELIKADGAPPLPAAGGQVPLLQARATRATATADAVTIGRDIATAINRALRR